MIGNLIVLGLCSYHGSAGQVTAGAGGQYPELGIFVWMNTCLKSFGSIWAKWYSGAKFPGTRRFLSAPDYNSLE